MARLLRRTEALDCRMAAVAASQERTIRLLIAMVANLEGIEVEVDEEEGSGSPA